MLFIKRFYPDPTNRTTAAVFVVLLFPVLLFSQSRSAFGIFSTTAYAEGPEWLFTNPSGLAAVADKTIGLASHLPFGMKELVVHSVAVAFPVFKGGMGFAMESTGFSLYRENNALLALAWRIRGLPAFGIGLRWTWIKIASYGSASTIGLDAGMLVPLGKRLDWGFVVSNPFPQSLGRSGSTLAQTTRAGIGFHPSENIGCSFELSKNTRGPWESRCLVEYRFSTILRIRFGFSRNPETFSTGVRLRPGPWIFEYESIFHPVLGISHGVVWCFAFGGKRN